VAGTHGDEIVSQKTRPHTTLCLTVSTYRLLIKIDVVDRFVDSDSARHSAARGTSTPSDFQMSQDFDQSLLEAVAETSNALVIEAISFNPEVSIIISIESSPREDWRSHIRFNVDGTLFLETFMQD
jgi:hypothetical protein